MRLHNRVHVWGITKAMKARTLPVPHPHMLPHEVPLYYAAYAAVLWVKAGAARRAKRHPLGGHVVVNRDVIGAVVLGRN